jgi:RNA polymerase sigma factor (sigma-70 family)
VCDADLLAALAGDQRARERVVQRTILRLSRLWANYSASIRDDVRQEVALGILRALEDYQPERGSFTTHAMWKARSRIDLFRDKNRSLLSGRRKRQHRRIASFDAALEDGGNLHELVADAEAHDPSDIAQPMPSIPLELLTAKQRRVVEMRLAGMTTGEIARELRVTHQAATHAVKIAVARLRRKLVER